MILIHANIKITKDKVSRLFAKYFIGFLLIVGLSNCGTPNASRTPTASSTQTPRETQAVQTPKPASHKTGISRGYLTTPQELRTIAEKAAQGLEPYQSAVNEVLQEADKEWNFELRAEATCPTANDPAWIDNGGGIRTLYAKSLAYHLAGDQKYAEEVKDILERIMTEVKTIPADCRLKFSWGTPELVASADLIEGFWNDRTCTGPTSTDYLENEVNSGNCKDLFQNWLVKNPYYVISFLAENGKANSGASSTNTMAYIADYLWDRPEVQLVHQLPPEISNEGSVRFSPAEGYAHANQLALDRMKGYGIEYGSPDSCDLLSGEQQRSDLMPVKSQITENGILPEDARRQEYCNITKYNGEYQNYPQLHLGHNIQQCELMLRRGDSSCYDNVENTHIPNYEFIGPDGVSKTTHLHPGRGSIELAIKAIIVDSGTEWRHDSALRVAFRYYFVHHTLPGIDQWAEQLSVHEVSCGQDICFGTQFHPHNHVILDRSKMKQVTVYGNGGRRERVYRG